MNNKVFKEIYNKEITPPNEIWDQIEAHLNQKQDKRFFVWKNWVGVASILVLIVAGIVGYYFYNSPSSNKTMQSQTKESLQYPSDQNEIPAPSPSSSNSIKPNSAPAFTQHNRSEKENVSKNTISEAITSPKLTSKKKVEKNKYEKNKPLIFQPKNISQSDKTVENYTVSASTKDKKKNIEDTTLLTEVSEEITIAAPQLPLDEIKTPQPKALSAIKMPELIDNKDIIARNKAQEIARMDAHKWRTYGYIAPSFSRSLNRNDVWVSDLSFYSGKYDNTTSFSILAEYTMPSKLKLRLGLKEINMAQTALNVPVVFNYINTYSNHTQIELTNDISLASINAQSISNFNAQATEIKIANIRQQIQYLSIPVEIGYPIINTKRFQLNPFAGLSANYLTQNKLMLFTQDIKTDFGQANNLNKWVVGSQLGLQFNYKFSPSINLILEPHSIYYFNIFNTKSNVKPYTFSFNSGISFSF